MKTPWGEVDSVDRSLENGAVKFVSTPSHGGVVVSRAWAEKNLSDPAREYATDWDSKYFYYEEDRDWAIVVFEKPALDLGNHDKAIKAVG